MVRLLKVLMGWSVTLISLSAYVASKGCTFKEDGCTYNIHLTYKDTKDPDLQNDNCGTKEQQIFMEHAQNDYAAKIDGIEKNFSFLRDTHEQRIKELESTVKEMGSQDRRVTAQASESIIRDMARRPSQAIFANEALMRKMEGEIHKLRDEIRLRTEELAETSTKLNETTTMLHESQLLHFKTSQDFLNAENEITTLKRERAVLKNQLKDRTYRLDLSTQEATECQAKSDNMQEQVAQLFRSENTLTEELMTVQLKLDKAKEGHGLMEQKHASLKTKHDKMRGVMKIRERELIECYIAKTSVFCDFEDPLVCGFTNLNNSADFFDWERGKGQTPTQETGPSKDHTCGGPNGHFMFIEASAKARGNNAILYSPLYRGLVEQCVEFFYHMHGKHVGTLNVYAQARGDVLRSAWRAYGNQGNVWTNARLAIPQELAMAGYQIAFEGITEKGYLGDISIDDVSVRDGPCPSDGKLVAVNIEVNSTNIANNMKALVTKLRRRKKIPVP